MHNFFMRAPRLSKISYIFVVSKAFSHRFEFYLAVCFFSRPFLGHNAGFLLWRYILNYLIGIHNYKMTKSVVFLVIILFASASASTILVDKPSSAQSFGQDYAGLATASGTDKDALLRALIDAEIKVLNDIRKKHNVSAVVQDAALSADAQAYAETLLALGALQHEDGLTVGENLYYRNAPIASAPTPVSSSSSSSNLRGSNQGSSNQGGQGGQRGPPNQGGQRGQGDRPRPNPGIIRKGDATHTWQSEYENYDFNSPPTTQEEFQAGNYGHYTAQVWKAVSQVGFGYAAAVDASGNLDLYVVARYSPQPNIIGEFAENVLKPARK